MLVPVKTTKVIGVRADRNRHKLPADMLARLEVLRQEIAKAKEYARRGRMYYWAIGKVWGPIETDPCSTKTVASKFSNRTYQHQFNG